MAKIFEETPNKTQLDTLNQNSQSNSQTLNNSLDNSLNQSANTQQENKGFFKIPENLLQFVPLIPLALESITGQKIPLMGGTLGEIHGAINQLTAGLAQVLTNQSQIFQRIVNLEKNANSHLTNLTQQFQSLRLTHTKERKEIEYNPNKSENYD
jgi:hypothetical protein